MAALERACQQQGPLRVLYLDDLLTTIAPAATPANPRPYFWKVDVRWKRKAETLHPIPDKIFALQALDQPQGRNLKAFFLEFDTGSMPVVRMELDKSSVLRKLISYGTSCKNDLHRAIYGFTCASCSSRRAASASTP